MWLDSKTNTLVYDLDPTQHERVRKIVPNAKPLANGYIAFPNTLYNLQLARWIGLDVPPPMRDYDWPGRFTPFHAQRVTSNFLAVHPRAFVFNDMGTGKTLSALWAADFVLRHNSGSKCLIVARLSTLQRVWADAIFQHFLSQRSCIVLHGSARKRRELLKTPADFYIINYDGVGIIKKELEARPDIRMVIIDEASAYRDGTTKRSKLARTLTATRDYLWLMTGTPTPNGPLDAYGLAKLVNNAGGESFLSYQSRVMQKVAMWTWVPKPGAHKAAHALMQPSIRFAISDCMDLPPCTTQRRDVELSAEQVKAYKQMRDECVLMLKSGHITAVNEAVVRLKLIQIACGAVYGADREIHAIDAAPRLRVLREVLEECQGKIIIYSSLTSVITMLNRELKEYSRAVVNGQVSHKERSEIFKAFESSKQPRVLIADPQTMSHGLTLVAARTVIWFSPTDRTELYLQANKRIDRPGQRYPTTIVQLAATPIEREIFKRIENNENMQGLVLKLAKGEL